MADKAVKILLNVVVYLFLEFMLHSDDNAFNHKIMGYKRFSIPLLTPVDLLSFKRMGVI